MYEREDPSPPAQDLSSVLGAQPVSLRTAALDGPGGRCPEPPSGMETSLLRCWACHWTQPTWGPLTRESCPARGHTLSDVHCQLQDSPPGGWLPQGLPTSRFSLSPGLPVGPGCRSAR